MTVPTQSRGWTRAAASRSWRRLGDDRSGVERIGAADQAPQLVVAQEHHVVRLVEAAGLDELPTDLDQDEANVRIRALVDVEVVVRRERRHAQVDVVGRTHLLERLAGQALEDLARGRLDVAAHRVDGGREVVVGREVATDELDGGLHLLADGREDELVAPDGVPAELALVRLDALGDEPPAALRRAEVRRRCRGPSSAANAARSSGSSRTSFFIRQSASIESQLRSDAEFWSRPSSCSSTEPRCFSMTARRFSVADSWAKLSIQWIFQWRSWMSMASSRRVAVSASDMPSAASRRSSR